jgi:hypothetical protein
MLVVVGSYQQVAVSDYWKGVDCIGVTVNLVYKVLCTRYSVL